MRASCSAGIPRLCIFTAEGEAGIVIVYCLRNTLRDSNWNRYHRKKSSSLWRMGLCFYRGHLLMAPDVVSLTAYIDAMENEEVLDDIPLYEEGIGSLSPTYSFGNDGGYGKDGGATGNLCASDTELFLSPGKVLPAFRAFNTIHLCGGGGISESGVFIQRR